MICAYDELYLQSAQRIMGDMLDFAVNTLGITLKEFYKLFLVSGLAHQIEIGNPTYVAGKNGCEVARLVLEECGCANPDEEDVMYIDKSREYWIGWALAFYQWKSCLTFMEISESVAIESMYGMYDTLHEADISLYVEIMDEKCRKRGNEMKLKNVLIVVKDIERSKRFYHDLFGLDVILDNDGNMILTEGLVLQEESIWKGFIGKEVTPQSNACELYFEETDLEAFVQKLENYYPEVIYVNRLMEHSWGQKVIRFYDPDGNLIEVGTPM